MNIKELNLSLINEIQAMREQIKTGRLSVELFKYQMGAIAQVGNAMDRHLNFMRFERKNKLQLSRVKGLLAYGDPEEQEILCPGLRESPVRRSTCLDYQGEDRFPECGGCRNGKETKSLLLGSNGGGR